MRRRSKISANCRHSARIDNIRVIVTVWRLGGILSELLCAGLCDTMCTHMSSSYRSSRFGLSHWDPYALHRGGCLELYYCNAVEWCWWDSSLICKTNRFPKQCFDTVDLVI